MESKKAIVFLLLAAVFLSACSRATTNPQTETNYMVEAVNAQATVAYAQTLDMATAQAREAAAMRALEVTRQYEATVSAIDIANAQVEAQALATQVAISGIATSDAQKLSVQATSDAQLATRTVANLDATAQAVVIAAESTRVYTDNMARQEQIERARRNQTFMMAAGSAFVAAVFMLLMAMTYRMITQARPMQAGEQYVFQTAGQPLVIGAPAPPRLLEERTVTSRQPAVRARSIRHQIRTHEDLQEGSIVIIGPTRTGKSTHARNIAEHRRQAGHNIIVIDPDYARGDEWHTTSVYDDDHIEVACRVVRTVFDKHTQDYQLHGADMITPPTTIIIDEGPVITGDDELKEMMVQILRRGAKRRVYLILISQTPRVRSLNIQGEGDLLHNATQILTGSYAVEKMPELRTVPYPAVVVGQDETVRALLPATTGATRESSATVAPPSSTLVAPDEQEYFNRTGPILEEERELILALHREGKSQREIERTIYGYNGGSAHGRIREVIYGETNSHHESNTDSYLLYISDGTS